MTGERSDGNGGWRRWRSGRTARVGEKTAPDEQACLKNDEQSGD
jgi:hypothetical protein